MPRFHLIVCTAGVLSLLTACERAGSASDRSLLPTPGPNASVDATAARPSPAVQEGGTAVEGGGTNPIHELKERETREAMRGLSYDTGRVVRAEPDASRIAPKPDPKQARLAFEEGNVFLFEQNRRTDAIRAYTRAVLLDSDEPEYCGALGRALNFKGKMPESLAAYRTGLDLDPASLELRAQIALTLQQVGDLEGSAATWDEVIARDPGNGEALSRLAIIRYYLGDYASAWRSVHAAEGLGHEVPPQFRELLAGVMPEPGL